MPGLLLPEMDSKISRPAEHLTNGVAHGSTTNEPSKLDAAMSSQKTAGEPLTNGDHSSNTQMAEHVPVTNGVTASEPDLGLPEELLQLIADNYWPMSTLIDRVTQECFNDLTELVGKLEDEGAPHIVNGVGGSAAAQAAGQTAALTAASVRKKQLLLDFANTHRNKFIRLMVILQWGRRAEEIQKLVKVRQWLNLRLGDIFESADAFGHLKQHLQAFKQPNPDIRTALEAISSGTASWIPDLGYIPPKPLSDTEMRQTLKNLDALLSIRINLHEELPRHLRDWDVANGRATFRIPDEFEFDVTIVDEDPSEQFYFVDIRFLFTPAPELPDSIVRVQLGDMADQALKSGGLQSCYEFLHDFVLTYKISALRKQAYEMARGAWHSNIRIENVHRSLIVQYWTRLQSKSWIEIGISSGGSNSSKVSWRGPGTSRLDVRWFRSGSESSLSGINLDWTTISMEKLLKQVISQHISWLLGSIERGLALHDIQGGLQIRSLTKSKDEPSDCCLTLCVSGQPRPCKVLVEPIGGRLKLSPPSVVSQRAEERLNSLQNPESTGPVIVERYPAELLAEHAKLQASHCGWRQISNLRLANPALKFQHGYLTISYFRGRNWGRIPWVIAYTVNLSGGSWWAVELAEAAVGDSIKSVYPITLPLNVSQRPLTPIILRYIESRAVITISLQLLAHQLTTLKAGHTLQQEPTPSTNDVVFAHPRLTVLVQAQRLLRSKDPKAESFADGLLRLYVQAYQKGSNLVEYMVRGALPSHSAKFLAESLSAVQDKDVKFAKGGSFALKISSPFGTSCVNGLVSRMLSLARVKGAVTALKKYKVQLNEVTLARISFEYQGTGAKPSDVAYTAELNFPSTSHDKPRITMNFFPNTNPHKRVQQQLAQLLNLSIERNATSAFETWVRTLLMSFPVLQALGHIEDRELRTDVANGSQLLTGLTVHARKLDWYRLNYHNKYLILDVRLKRVRDKVVWIIEQSRSFRQSSQPTPPEISTSLVEALKSAWAERGSGWRGLKSCVEASYSGVEEAILKVDQIIRDEVAALTAAGSTTTQSQQPQAGRATSTKNSKQQQGNNVVDLT